ncbi:MAG TPA: CotH kinase family protein, partial [Polyangiaceae bacterium]|nr:CotH kinase family protein [Polyangiaceae bacterium]
LAYDLFISAGYPAPRCNFAHVTINGRDAGIYTQVEAIDESLLRERFGSANGPLYRGELADFDPRTEPLLFNSTQNGSRTALRKLIDALDAPDAELVEHLEQVLDLNAFRDFWALETLIGHWDGYTNNADNFYAYFDPHQKRFVFLPWGADQAFVGTRPWLSGYEPTVYYKGKIANRLYQIPKQRALFRKRLTQHNDRIWSVPDLLARIDALAALTGSGDAQALEELREYVRTRGESLRAALAEPAPEVPRFAPFEPTPLADSCAGQLTELSGSFSVRYGDNPYAAVPGEGQLRITSYVDGQPYTGEFFGAFGPNPILTDHTSLLVATDLPSGMRIGYSLLLPNELYVPGVHPMHAWETLGIAVVIGPGTLNLTDFGYIGDGQITLDRVSHEVGGTVSGSFSGKLYPFGCLHASAQ